MNETENTDKTELKQSKKKIIFIFAKTNKTKKSLARLIQKKRGSTKKKY